MFYFTFCMILSAFPLIFCLFCSVSDGKVVLASESLFQPANGVWSTCSLVEILNTSPRKENFQSRALWISAQDQIYKATRNSDKWIIQGFCYKWKVKSEVHKNGLLRNSKEWIHPQGQSYQIWSPPELNVFFDVMTSGGLYSLIYITIHSP